MRHLMHLLALIAVPTVLSSQGHCRESREPDPLPMTMQIVDSAALASALGRVVLPPTTYSLWYASSGQLTHVLALADSLVARRLAPADSGTLMRTQIATVISGAAFPLDSGRAVTLRMTISHDSAGGLSVALAHSIACDPELARSIPVGRATVEVLQGVSEGRVVSSMNLGGNDMALSGTAELTIDAAGHVTDVRIIRSSDNSASDNILRQSLLSRVYRPALMDGFPRPTVIEVQAAAEGRR